MWVVFVTAPEASVRLFLGRPSPARIPHDALGALDLSSGPAKGEFAVLTSKNLANIVPPDLGVLPHINKFVRENEKTLQETLELSTHHWVVMEHEVSRGVEAELHRVRAEVRREREFRDGYTNEFRAARIDQEDVLSMLNNLDIANMDWRTGRMTKE
ncbi:hypothetical protein B0H13DRAFT_2106020 [Mycena leptocephala]|nr:hypothetical protein B0H13DRAFT_2106020 [Mycena leptocephala]